MRSLLLVGAALAAFVVGLWPSSAPRETSRVSAREAAGASLSASAVGVRLTINAAGQPPVVATGRATFDPPVTELEVAATRVHITSKAIVVGNQVVPRARPGVPIDDIPALLRVIASNGPGDGVTVTPDPDGHIASITWRAGDTTVTIELGPYLA